MEEKKYIRKKIALFFADCSKKKNSNQNNLVYFV